MEEGYILNVGVAGFELISGSLPYAEPLPDRRGQATLQMELNVMRVFRVSEGRRSGENINELRRIHQSMMTDLPRVVESWGSSRHRGSEHAVRLQSLLGDLTDRLGRTIVESWIFVLQQAYFDSNLKRRTPTKSGSRWGQVVARQLAALRIIESVDQRVAVQAGKVAGEFHEFRPDIKPVYVDTRSVSAIFGMYDVLGKLAIGQQRRTSDR